MASGPSTHDYGASPVLGDGGTAGLLRGLEKLDSYPPVHLPSLPRKQYIYIMMVKIP